jgi:hypothetical protein
VLDPPVTGPGFNNLDPTRHGFNKNLPASSPTNLLRN